jgi:PAB-dependent poly(A)-specific ribonuclease subunit 3
MNNYCQADHSRTHNVTQLDHHLYTTPLPHTANLPASHLPLHNFFLPADLLAFIHGRAEAKLASRSADGSLPTELHVYHSLHTLMAEATPQERSMRAYDVWKVSDGSRTFSAGGYWAWAIVTLGFKLGKETAFSVLDKWRRIRHPNIVSVREAFTTRLFNDSCMLLVLKNVELRSWSESR